MVSKRTYFTLMLLMGIIFFLFIATGALKERWNDYQSNPYAESDAEVFTARSVWKESEKGESSSGQEAVQDAYKGDGVVYLGNLERDAAGDTVIQWCTYTKRALRAYQSLSDWPGLEEETPEVVLIEPDYLETKDLQKLTALAERGVSMVFCHAPKVEDINFSRVLRQMLGIKKVEAVSCNVIGYKLYGGFLLGGETHYIAERPEDEKRQDMNLETPWYKLGSGTKLYMVGMLEQEANEVKNEELPAILWRSSYKNAQVFTVNGDYMEDTSGVGLLNAMMSELHDYEIYPVVNAQNFVVLNGPDLTSENEGKMQEIYSRSTRLVIRDLIFPGLAALSGVTGFPMTCMTTQGLDSNGADAASYEDMIYYLKWLREQKAEVGISLDNRSGTSLQEGAEEFWQFLQENQNTYSYSALYVPAKRLSEGVRQLCGQEDIFTELQTIVSETSGSYQMLDYVSDQVTYQKLTSNVSTHTYTEDFQLRAMETGLGYSSAYIDLERVLYPESEEDQWEKLSEKISSNLSTYWKPFSAFDKTVLSESDRRVRQFLALDYADQRKGNTIELAADNLEEEAWFILRTHGERIKEIEGAEWKKIERDAYLLTVTEPKVTITLEEEVQPYYYE